MQKQIVLSFFLLFGLATKAQDSIRKFEFGSTLVTVNSFNTNYQYEPDRPAFEYLNSLFFRYTKNRFGIRGELSYSDVSLIYTSPKDVADGFSGDINNKDFRIGGGVQYAFVKKRQWIYTLLDMYYRNVFSTGHFYGGIWGASDKFSKSANGLDNFLGVGFKIKTIKHVYLSPELGYYCSTKFVNEISTPLFSNESTRYRYTEVNIYPINKLRLTVGF